MPGETPLDVQIRNTTRNMAYVLTHVVALRAEMIEMRKEFKAVSEAIFKLLADPESIHREEAVKKDTRKKNLE